MKSTISITEASAAKEAGIRQVIDNNHDDFTRIFGFANDWIRTKRGEFTAEDLKTDYLKLNQPLRNQNLYGACFSSLSKLGKIQFLRYQKSRLKAAKNRVIAVWISNGQIPMFS